MASTGREPPWRSFLRVFGRNRLAVAAAALVASYLAIALLAPVVVPYGPLDLVAEPYQGPRWPHLFGTDHLGRDMLSRVVYGARISLYVSGLSVGLALAVGTVIGAAAGYFGGWLDLVVSRVVDVMFALPEIVLALVVMAVLGQSFTNITLAIGIVYTPIFARVARASVQRAAAQPYVEAARSLGLGHTRILWRHVLPNAAGPIIVQTTLSLAFAILAESALSFLGLSGESDAPSWGLMLRAGKDYMEIAWHLAVFPGLAITGAVLAFNVLGDGLRDALDPTAGRGG